MEMGNDETEMNLVLESMECIEDEDDEDVNFINFASRVIEFLNQYPEVEISNWLETMKNTRKLDAWIEGNQILPCVQEYIN